MSVALTLAAAFFAISFLLNSLLLNIVNKNLSKLENVKIIVEKLDVCFITKKISIKNIRVLAKVEENTFINVVNKAEGSLVYMPEENSLSLKLKGDVPYEDSGRLSTDITFTSLFPELSFKGSINTKNVPIAYFYPYLADTKKTQVQKGKADINTTFAYSKGKLDSNSRINLDDITIQSSEKKLFGLPAELVADYLNNNSISFNLPVKGRMNKLDYGFNTAVTEILTDALDEKFKNKNLLNKIAEKYGNKAGKTITDIISETEK
jgi:hypothetical protein